VPVAVRARRVREALVAVVVVAACGKSGAGPDAGPKPDAAIGPLCGPVPTCSDGQPATVVDAFNGVAPVCGTTAPPPTCNTDCDFGMGSACAAVGVSYCELSVYFFATQFHFGGAGCALMLPGAPAEVIIELLQDQSGPGVIQVGDVAVGIEENALLVEGPSSMMFDGPVGEFWLRVRFGATTIYDSSSDGSDWTTFGSDTATQSPTSVSIQDGYSATQTDPCVDGTVALGDGIFVCP
jgi:hypothetical protein